MKIGNMVTNPGELRVPVALQTPVISTDAGGAQSTSFQTISYVFAKWTNVHGAEAWSDQARSASFPATVLIRYYANLTTAWVLEKDGQRYQIVSIDDIQERHEYMELKVQRLVGSI
jgi:SPP1 family predicted phage head-tail adaptor